MLKTNAVRQVFFEASTEQQFQNKWLADEAWVEIMNDTVKHFIVTKELLNKALSGVYLTPPLQLITNKKRNICGKRMIYFYFIANGNSDKQKYQNPNNSWADIYNNVRIPRKRLRVALAVLGQC